MMVVIIEGRSDVGVAST